MIITKALLTAPVDPGTVAQLHSVTGDLRQEVVEGIEGILASARSLGRLNPNSMLELQRTAQTLTLQQNLGGYQPTPEAVEKLERLDLLRAWLFENAGNPQTYDQINQVTDNLCPVNADGSRRHPIFTAGELALTTAQVALNKTSGKDTSGAANELAIETLQKVDRWIVAFEDHARVMMAKEQADGNFSSPGLGEHGFVKVLKDKMQLLVDDLFERQHCSSTSFKRPSL